jgi:hypothetical protein
LPRVTGKLYTDSGQRVGVCPGLRLALARHGLRHSTSISMRCCFPLLLSFEFRASRHPDLNTFIKPDEPPLNLSGPAALRLPVLMAVTSESAARLGSLALPPLVKRAHVGG